MIVLWLLSRVLHNNLLLALAGLVILAGPAVVSLLAKDKSYAIFLRNIAYAAEPVVAAMTNSGHKLPHNLQTRILQINLLGDIGKVPNGFIQSNPAATAACFLPVKRSRIAESPAS